MLQQHAGVTYTHLSCLSLVSAPPPLPPTSTVPPTSRYFTGHQSREGPEEAKVVGRCCWRGEVSGVKDHKSSGSWSSTSPSTKPCAGAGSNMLEPAAAATAGAPSGISLRLSSSGSSAGPVLLSSPRTPEGHIPLATCCTMAAAAGKRRPQTAKPGHLNCPSGRWTVDDMCWRHAVLSLNCRLQGRHHRSGQCLALLAMCWASACSLGKVRAHGSHLGPVPGVEVEGMLRWRTPRCWSSPIFVVKTLGHCSQGKSPPVAVVIVLMTATGGAATVWAVLAAVAAAGRGLAVEEAAATGRAGASDC